MYHSPGFRRSTLACRNRYQSPKLKAREKPAQMAATVQKDVTTNSAIRQRYDRDVAMITMLAHQPLRRRFRPDWTVEPVGELRIDALAPTMKGNVRHDRHGYLATFGWS